MIYIPDVDCFMVRMFVNYIYGGEVMLPTLEHVDDFLKLLNLFLVLSSYTIEDGKGNYSVDLLNSAPGDCFKNDSIPLQDDYGSDEDYVPSNKTKKRRYDSVFKKPDAQKKSDVVRKKRKYVKRKKDELKNGSTFCDLCGQNYTCYRALCIHKEKAHSESKEGLATVHLRGKNIPLSEIETVLPYQCEKCLKRFETSTSCYKHKKYICPVCGRCLGWKANYDKHMVTHGSTEAYKCIQCDKGFKTSTLLVGHELSVHENTYSCKPCNKQFLTRVKLRDHQKRKHERSYLCEVCNSTFDRPGKLRQHNEEQHGNLPQLTCQHCPPEAGKSFNGPKSLQRHINLMHVERTLLCSECGEAFRFQSYLNEHIKRNHSGDDRNHHCSECPATFKTERNLKVHEQLIHIRDFRFQCTQCGKQFKQKGELKSHLITHSNDKPFKCPHGCGVAFKRKISMNDHVKEKHTGDTKFSCDTCKKGFMHKFDLTVHIRTHTGEKPYKCHMCKSAFIKNSYLKDHLRRFHAESNGDSLTLEKIIE